MTEEDLKNSLSIEDAQLLYKVATEIISLQEKGGPGTLTLFVLHLMSSTYDQFPELFSHTLEECKAIIIKG